MGACEWKYRCKFEYIKPIIVVASPQCATRACLPVYAILIENSRIFAYSLWNKLTPETNNTSWLTPIFRHTHILMTKYDIESSRRWWDERRWRQSEVDVWSLLVQTAAVSAGLPMLCTCSLQTHTDVIVMVGNLAKQLCVRAANNNSAYCDLWRIFFHQHELVPPNRPETHTTHMKSQNSRSTMPSQYEINCFCASVFKAW